LNGRAYRVCLRGEQLLYRGLSHPVEIARRRDLGGEKSEPSNPIRFRAEGS
jgi:hypothetical protein